MNLDDWIEKAQYVDFQSHRIASWSEGVGRPLLLIHGYPTAAWDWNPVWRQLAESRRVITCDMLGFGLSDKPASGYSICRQADLYESVLEQFDISDCDVVAHDYGVTVAQELLARQIDGTAQFTIGKLALLNGGIFPEQHRALLVQKLGVSPFGFIVGLLMSQARFEKSFCAVFGEQTQPSRQELDDYWRLITANDGHRKLHKLLHYIPERNAHRDRWVGAIQNSPVPLKLINGGADPVSGRHLCDYFQEMVPAGEAVCLEAIGHYPQLEAPERCLAELNAFL